MGDELEVRLAAPADVPGMAQTLTQAFADDPVMTWLFGTEPPRPHRYLEPFMAHEGKRHLGHDRVYTADGHPGAAYWNPPGQWKASYLDFVRAAPVTVRGIRSRLLKALRGFNQMERAHAAHPDHYYLAVLGTRPDRQGQGLGAALMAPVLATCDAEGVGAYLEASKEANIPFYRRHGFELVGDAITFPDGPSLWPMWRDPQAPPSA